MKTKRLLASLPMIAGLLLPISHAKERNAVGDKVEAAPSVPGGVPLKVDLHKITSAPAERGGEVPADTGSGGRNKKIVKKARLSEHSATINPPAPPVAESKDRKKGKNGVEAPLAPEGKKLDAKASDLTRVTYRGPSGVQSFVQSGPNLWKNADIAYDEVERDEFSIFLIREKTDTDRVVIDLHGRKVSFFSGPVDEGPDASYPILSASGGKVK